MKSSFRKNLTILGPPGSGKGFYGRSLAEYLGLTLVTASTILREQRPDLDLTSGRLLECELVSQILSDYFLNQQQSKHYLLDGFPRTAQQIVRMERVWPMPNQVHLAILLDVPDAVCVQKMLGRRRCRKCGQEHNVANVDNMGFSLPPQIPEPECEDCVMDVDWISRKDDVPDIAKRRLAIYREHETPVVDFYQTQGRLLRFTPYRGELDVPRMQWTVEDWLKTFD